MAFDFLRRKSPGEDAVELPVEPEQKEKITVRVENVSSVLDVERIEKLLREGNILMLKVQQLQSNDLGEFKNVVEKLKRRCIQFGWDLVAIADGYLVMTPKFARIVR